MIHIKALLVGVPLLFGVGAIMYFIGDIMSKFPSVLPLALGGITAYIIGRLCIQEWPK